MKPKLKWLIAIASVGAFAGIGLGISACENKRKQNSIRKNNLLSITEPTNLTETSGYSGTWTLGTNNRWKIFWYETFFQGFPFWF